MPLNGWRRSLMIPPITIGISKFPTNEDFEELKYVYDLTSNQIMSEFHEMRKNSQYRSVEQYQNPSKHYWTPPRLTYQSIMESATHSKIVHLNKQTSVQCYPRHWSQEDETLSNSSSNQCNCFSLGRQRASSFEHVFKAGQVTCKKQDGLTNFQSQLHFFLIFLSM